MVSGIKKPAKAGIVLKKTDSRLKLSANESYADAGGWIELIDPYGLTSSSPVTALI